MADLHRISQQDFPDGKINIARFIREIQNSPIKVALDYERGVTLSGGLLDVWFMAMLDEDDAAILDALPAAHDPSPLPGKQSTVKLDEIREEDGRLNVVNSPMPPGWMLYYTSKGDDPDTTPNYLGGHGALALTFGTVEDDPVRTKETFIQFRTPAAVNDGGLEWKPVENWVGRSDFFSLFIDVRPNTAFAPADPPNTGNVQYIAHPPNGLPPYLVPALGNDGLMSLDLNDAIPFPALMPEQGHWDVDRVTGVVRPADVPGKGRYDLYCVGFRVYIVKDVTCGSPRGIFDPEAETKSEWIHQNWRVGISVTKGSSGAGEASAWVKLYRTNVVHVIVS